MKTMPTTTVIWIILTLLCLGGLPAIIIVHSVAQHEPPAPTVHINARRAQDDLFFLKSELAKPSNFDDFRNNWGGNVIEGHVLQVLPHGVLLYVPESMSRLCKLAGQTVYVNGPGVRSNTVDGEEDTFWGEVTGRTQYTSINGVIKTVSVFTTVPR